MRDNGTSRGAALSSRAGAVFADSPRRGDAHGAVTLAGDGAMLAERGDASRVPDATMASMSTTLARPVDELGRLPPRRDGKDARARARGA